MKENEKLFKLSVGDKITVALLKKDEEVRYPYPIAFGIGEIVNTFVDNDKTRLVVKMPEGMTFGGSFYCLKDGYSVITVMDSETNTFTMYDSNFNFKHKPCYYLMFTTNSKMILNSAKERREYLKGELVIDENRLKKFGEHIELFQHEIEEE